MSNFSYPGILTWTTRMIPQVAILANMNLLLLMSPLLSTCFYTITVVSSLSLRAGGCCGATTIVAWLAEMEEDWLFSSLKLERSAGEPAFCEFGVDDWRSLVRRIRTVVNETLLPKQLQTWRHPTTRTKSHIRVLISTSPVLF